MEKAWKAVMREAESLGRVTLSELFERDPGRFDRLSFRDGDLLVDFSKEKIDAEALAAAKRAVDLGGSEAATYRATLDEIAARSI